MLNEPLDAQTMINSVNERYNTSTTKAADYKNKQFPPMLSPRRNSNRSVDPFTERKGSLSIISPRQASGSGLIPNNAFSAKKGSVPLINMSHEAGGQRMTSKYNNFAHNDSTSGIEIDISNVSGEPITSPSTRKTKKQMSPRKQSGHASPTKSNTKDGQSSKNAAMNFSRMKVQGMTGFTDDSVETGVIGEGKSKQ